MSEHDHEGTVITDGRAVSTVVGVAVLLGATVVALGVLTAGIGATIQGNAASADVTRAVEAFDALHPVATTGRAEVRMAATGGHLSGVERDLRVLRNGSVVRTVAVGGIVYDRRDRRAAFVAGAVVRGPPDGARVVTGPPVIAGDRARTLVVGTARARPDGAVGIGGSGATIRTNVSHERTALGRGRYAVAIETATPNAFERWFEARATSVERRSFDDDGVTSVVARFRGERTAHLVVHDTSARVGGSG
ncbi:hypothetical protein BRD17_04065 [Halobacteriales archaeon SW_7_68_16]|nr:MAG: hypothetical protein BRD17_04065 [Halobacteriales archaeon SW_7_68_16]